MVQLFYAWELFAFGTNDNVQLSALYWIEFNYCQQLCLTSCQATLKQKLSDFTEVNADNNGKHLNKTCKLLELL